MKLLLLSAMVAVAAASSPPPADCQCDLALAHEEPPVVIYQLPGDWYGDCGEHLHHDCLNECHVRRDELESVGAWEADIGDGATVGELGCAAIGRDELTGVHSVLLGALCGERLTEEGQGLREPLCCQDGAPIHCQAP